MVRAGSQYIAIDLSPFDYIYSDSINRFINLNRVILDINGRIVIVAPHQKVFELLERAGMLNFIKVVRSIDDLIIISKMIANNPAFTPQKTEETPPEDLSEFDSFKGALEDAMCINSPEGQTTKTAVDFQDQHRATTPDTPLSPTNFQAEENIQEYSSETSIFEADKNTSLDLDSAFTSEDTPLTTPSLQEEHHSDEIHNEKKATPIIPIIAIFLTVILIGAILFFVLGQSSQNKEGNTTLEKTPQVSVAEILSDTVSEKNDTTLQVKDTVNTVPSDVPAKTEVVQTPQKQVPSKKVTKSPKRKKITTKAPVKTSQILITSTPSSATVEINGKVFGLTPYTMMSPPYGDILVRISKQGYEETQQRIVYEGGQRTVSLILPVQKQVVVPVKKQPVQKQVVAPVKKQVVEPVKKQPVKKQVVAPVAQVATIFFNSLPPMAEIYENNVLVGKTNVAPIKTTPGSHTYTFVKGAQKASITVQLRNGRNSAPMIRLK